MVKLLSQSCQLGAVSILNARGAHHCFEELALEDDFRTRMDVIWLDAQAIVELFEVLLFLLVFCATRIIISLLCGLDG